MAQIWDATNGSGANDALGARVQSLRLDHQTRRTASDRSRAASRWPYVVVVVAIGLLVYRELAGRGQSAKSPDDDLANIVRPTSAAAVRSTATASTPAKDDSGHPSPVMGEVVLESKGYIVPTHQILVSPKVGGMVTKLYVEEGMRVKKGQVLAELETTEYQAEVDRCEATLAAARHRLLELERGNRPEEIDQVEAELAEAIATREQLYSEWQRSIRLRPTRSLADRDFELAESAYKAQDRRVERLRAAVKLMKEGPRKERIDAARADVKQAEAELVKAKWRLDNTKVVAPASGTILSKKAEEGNLVNAMAMNGSFSLVELADLSDLEVDLAIQERDISRVFKGQKCRIRSEAFPERLYEGHVSRLMPIADRAKGAVTVRVKVTVPPEEEGVYLKPDMGVVVSFLAGQPRLAN